MTRDIPDSIGNLKNLETLDLKHCRISTLPRGILKLKKSLSVCGYWYRLELSVTFSSTYGMSLPTAIGGLTNLQNMGIVEVHGDGDMVGELGKLTQLRRLGILKLAQENRVDLCSSL